ncbi:MAG: hypothetical protein FJW39_26640 [Acidobacteria bacterium]|nr:hypothetical protein [Acidobacteriota bacterium]
MVLTKQELIACLQKEVRILVPLCGKVRPEMLDYRPTPKRRSTIELLRYLAMMGPALVPAIRKGAFDPAAWGAAEAAGAAMDFDALVKSIESQSEGYASAIGEMADEDFRGEIEMFGSVAARGLMILNMVVCGHAAYRNQLFCYLKACGREELNTMNLWAGVDGSM